VATLTLDAVPIPGMSTLRATLETGEPNLSRFDRFEGNLETGVSCIGGWLDFVETVGGVKLMVE